MNAAFGSVSAGGTGTPEFEVPDTGGGPCAFVASHPEGKAGGIWKSKFSCIVVRIQQGGHGGGGLDPAAAATTSTRPQAVSSREINPSARWPVARDTLITAAASATTAAVAIANLVARLIEPFMSLCRCRVKGKTRRITSRETVLGNNSGQPQRVRLELGLGLND
jgi:hypothetical protein